MLKHCILLHSDLKPEEVKFGMRIRRQFRTPLERQVGEAIANLTEQEKETCLMNSKSEFNRCTLPRITAENREGIIEDLRRKEAAENSLKAEIRCLKKRKKEEKRKTATLEEVCEEILEEGKPIWKKRRKLYDKEREEFEKKEQLRIEREERLRRASEKREEFPCKYGGLEEGLEIIA